MSSNTVKSPRNNPIKLESNNIKNNKYMFGRTNSRDLMDKSIKPPSPIIKSEESSTEIVKPILNRGRKKIKPVTSIEQTPKELDLLLRNMNLTVLFFFIDKDAEIIMVMTPIGTKIAIKLDSDKDITINEEKRINFKSSNGNKNIKSSYLTSISKYTDLGSLVVCNDGMCVLEKNSVGKIMASNYNLSDNTPFSNFPSSYPLVLLSDLTTNYRNNYVEFLLELRNQANRINSHKKVNPLTRNIEFLENLLSNLKTLETKVKDFESVNREEMAHYSNKAVEMLKNNKIDQNIIDKLYILNNNVSFVNDGINKFNSFRECLDSMEQESYSYYFSLYGRVVKTIELPEHIEIRRPSNWTLSSVLPETESLIKVEGNTISSKELIKIINADISRYDPRNNEDETNVLMSALRASF